MAFWASVLIVLVTTAMVVLYRLGALRRRRAREPPLDRGLIPWLGHARDFYKDASSFLKRMQERHGDIFTVQLAGQYVTFIADPFSFDAILKEKRNKLDTSKLVSGLMFKVFEFQGHECHGNFMHSSTPKHLRSTGLVGMTQAMMDSLKVLLLEPDVGMRPGPQEWKQDELFQYCCNVVFRAGYLAVFGNLPTNGKAGHAQDLLQSQKVFEEFRKLDTLFPRAFFSVLLPKEKQEMKRLKDFFWDVLSPQHIMEKNNVSEWIRSAQEQQADEGVPEITQRQFNLILLWVSHGNTGVVSFWALLFLLKNPQALKAVREEAERVLRKMGQEMRPGGVPITVEYSMLQQTPVLDSVMEETLRLVVTAFLTRTIMEDMILKMDDGREYALRQGDEVSIFPYLFLHRDPEIYPDPTTFKYDRFLNSDGSRKVAFYKQGRKVKSHMLPWGAGTTICPGRFFALNEMKMFVFLMVAQYDMELVDQEMKIPSIDLNRFGIGATQPIHDVQFRFRMRF
ncbi:7-alpha-hydroxycholest-4-en-3-one 12-alpha-hydroxylase-like [Trichosurus vulpecula]|uniref:7-alpha-hydroxycholest-4-en-3-one 12-alpha-hydroxylase-like n=1 Tax=Trichosurus vulpecula TaxID=9337 RepID=UPI00186B3B89|nr:7-alpha-hydroxycholest-4-en-3-one 12-alpha-hydroxylase-like [Trichosurus vulpecula]XP_036593773.1 7-alpha-hydroxycholest-4-en-3-one 12-alpha-hydroxylase-like [Trichosurus vulpecula]XP_036593774.1 7-alpha-hydroxycholest-4-en-3-one 12-alpha-hydroxylase-like [Trichosurus vulpecula]XP_036593775.1 7-alpha-hydroxycholest-4-en-3-one 12-alpha-hydroxylase-like [Trichosurus vulpecula]XP_036593776.1 7-alpha-hydroxycholest-4-en-3-one 12-alpha-hydroxylase-like [Trichosurus vulpecula]XP_036593777.1 7-alp